MNLYKVSFHSNKVESDYYKKGHHMVAESASILADHLTDQGQVLDKLKLIEPNVAIIKDKTNEQ